jgi:thioredoxin reductase (NADPH)
VVDDHDATRSALVNSLQRRFGPDYRVLEASSAEAAQIVLGEVRDAGTEVAMIVANEYMQDRSGTAFLAATREAFPTARRLVLADFADSWVMPAISRASTLGEVDHFGYLPWGENDERFLAGIADIIADWSQENGQGDARMTIVGERGDRAFHLLGETLQRWQTYPIDMLEAGTPTADTFLAERKIEGELPIISIADGRVLTGANLANLSDMVGQGVDTASTTYDVAVVGLGPGGFSAALNAGAEGLSVIMIEATYSQASSSPMIRNYLGFPAGVSGAELMRRAWTQVLMFGAVGRLGRYATGIRRERGWNVVTLDDGSSVTSDVVMLALGVDYRRMGVPSVDRLVGRGVFYGYGALDAQAMSGLDVAVVGGANSAVQAAAHLARYARSVHLIVRGESLAHSASEYLIEQVDALPNVTVHLNSEITEGHGRQQLRSVTLRNRVTGETRDEATAGLFIMIGAVPRTDWLPTEIARDSQGFILTGEDGPPPRGPEQFRFPYETTMPGVFALGDVRSGSVKRIAAAVGEGAAAVQEVIRYRERVSERERAQRDRALGEPMPIGGEHR